MATSGSTNYVTTRDAIITEALELMGVLSAGETPAAADVTSLNTTLNYMVKHFQAVTGGTLWTLEEWVVFLKKNQRNYLLKGYDDTNDTVAEPIDHFCKADELVYTFVATAGAVTDTSIVVDSYTMKTFGSESTLADNWKIGIQTTNNVVEWFDLDGTPSSTTISFDGGGGAGLAAAAAINNIVYFYNPSIVADPAPANREFPKKVWDEACFIRDGYSSSDTHPLTDTPVEVIPWSEYADLSVKATTGTVNSIYYSPKRTRGELHVWPMTDNEVKHLVLWGQRSIEDFDAAGDNPDFPQEWLFPLAFNLAMYSAVKFGVPREQLEWISSFASSTLKTAMDASTEGKMRLQPDDRGHS